MIACMPLMVRVMSFELSLPRLIGMTLFGRGAITCHSMLCWIGGDMSDAEIMEKACSALSKVLSEVFWIGKNVGRITPEQMKYHIDQISAIPELAVVDNRAEFPDPDPLGKEGG